MSQHEPSVAHSVEIHVDNGDDYRSLYRWLRRDPALAVTALPSSSREGEQGAGWEVLSVAFGSGGAGIAAMQVVRTWLESRRSNISIRVKILDKDVQINATNMRDVMPVLEKMMNDS